MRHDRMFSLRATAHIDAASSRVPIAAIAYEAIAQRPMMRHAHRLMDAFHRCSSALPARRHRAR